MNDLALYFLIIFMGALFAPATCFSVEAAAPVNQIHVVNYTASFFSQIKNGDFEAAIEFHKKNPGYIDLNMIRENGDNSFSLLMNYSIQLKDNKNLQKEDEQKVFDFVKSVAPLQEKYAFNNFAEVQPAKLAEAFKDIVEMQEKWQGLFDYLIENNSLLGVDFKKTYKRGDKISHLAAKQLSDDNFLKLIKQNSTIDLNTQNWFKRSPLLYLAMGSKVKSLEYLLNQGPVVTGFDQADYVGHNLLFYLLETKASDEFVLNLIEKKPELVKSHSKLDRTDIALTPLQIAASHNLTKVVEKIIEIAPEQVNFRAAANKGKSSLMLAVEFAKSETIQKLIAAGADVKALDNNGDSILHLAVKGKKSENVKSVLSPDLLNLQNIKGNTALHLALLNSDSQISQMLMMQNEINYKIPNKDGEIPFLLAAKSGDLELVNLFIGREIDLNAKDKNGKTALFYLLENYEYEKIAELLQQHKGDWDYSGVDLDGNNVAHYMAARGMDKELMILVEKNPALLNSQNKKGKTPLQQAIVAGKIELALKLIDLPQIKLDYRDKTNRTVVYEAIHANNLELLTKLNAKMGDSFFNEKNSFPQLHFAAYIGASHSLDFLLGMDGVDINEQSETDAYTPLQMAVNRSNFEVVQKLLAAGADPFLADNKGGTAARDVLLKEDLELIRLIYGQHPEKLNEALFDAVNGGASFEVFELLVSMGADLSFIPDVGIYAGFDLFNYAVEKENEDVIRNLAAMQSFDANKKGPDGQTPLMRLVRKANSYLIETLFEVSDVDVNQGIVDRKGRIIVNPLLLSFEAEDEDVITALLNHEKTDINVIDMQGNNPLMLAIENEYESIARKLLEKGADFHLKNENDEDALMIALRKGLSELVKEMVLRGASLDNQYLRYAVRGTAGSNEDFLKELIKLGADIEHIKYLIRHSNISFDKQKFFEWMDQYLKTCRISQMQNNDDLAARGLASQMYPFKKQTSCMDTEIWSERNAASSQQETEVEIENTAGNSPISSPTSTDK